jgi:hypothetical protein
VTGQPGSGTSPAPGVDPTPAPGVLGSVDAQVFLARLTRLDPGALVRIRPVSSSSAARTSLWARLPWRVLVTREVLVAADGEVSAGEDVTVEAAALLRATDRLPPRQDARWHWPLPPAAGTVLETLPAAVVRKVAAAAASTLRQVSKEGLAGRAVGSRVVRDALLDHVPVMVEAAGHRVEVPQRLIQAVVRMGFLGDGDTPVLVRHSARWVGLAAQFGTAWLPPPPGLLSVRPI